MKYLSAIIILITLNTITVVSLIYFAKKSELIEEEVAQFKSEILTEGQQLNINEVEYNFHNNYSYLKKLQKIYLDIENKNLIKNNLISLENFKNSDLANVYKVISN